MRRCERRPLDGPDPVSGLPYGWTVTLDDGRQVEWTGLQTGPLTLDSAAVDGLCQRLLGVPRSRLAAVSERVLVPATGDAARRPAVILHSTTPDLRTFDGDLDALTRGTTGGDFTTYKEARSVYLAAPGDVVVGRTPAWRAAVRAMGARGLTLEDQDHYYLSHALLYLADRYEAGSDSCLDRLAGYVRDMPRVVRLYAFEEEMQIFLLWLARTAGVDSLAVEANRPAISAAWNRKDVLHPTVEQAEALGDALPESASERLAAEHRHCELAERMGLHVPSLPGYTLLRRDRSLDDFRRQLEAAARRLRQGYGLTTGCLKASESGDGARITPGIDLSDAERLEELAADAYRHGDAYVLEAHVHYGQARLAGQLLPTALSAHVRGGELAPGATIQFVEGTSWKGNVLLDAASAPQFGVPAGHYERFRRFVDAFRQAFVERRPGLVLAGIDVAVGRVGGDFGEDLLLGVQDLNVSFTGAECLRAFLDKARRVQGPGGAGYGVTRIYRPTAAGDHAAFLEVTEEFIDADVYADTVASIPGRWAMVGITGRDPEDAMGHLNRLQEALVEEGLIAAD